MDNYSEVIHKSRYARWDYDNNQREDWADTVDRVVKYFQSKFDLSTDEHEELFTAIHDMDVMPSMRMMWTAGKAADKSNVSIFNCSYTAIDDPKAFDEIMYILLNGTGVGFSVDRSEIVKLPVLPEELYESDSTIVVKDSKLGWASAYRELISLLYSGKIPKWDMSKVRPKGSILKTFGGRSSGPDCLVDLFEYTVNLFKSSLGRRLTSIEVHGLVCKIAEIVVVGGVRRSALISLSNLSDDRMRHAKSGQWWLEHPEYALANNSAIYTEKPAAEMFMREWLSLIESKSGERGIINTEALLGTAPARRKEYFDSNKITKLGTNPCVTGSTPILTDQGHFPITDFIGKEVNIWNGIEWSIVKPFHTGFNDVVRVTLSDGSSLDCTPEHEFVVVGGSKVKAQDLEINTKLEKFSMPTIDGTIDWYDIDGYSQGFYSGDGNTGLNHSWLYDTKYSCESRLEGSFGVENGNRKTWKHGPMYDKSFVPINGDIDYCLDWLAGLCDSDGTVTNDKNGNGIQICSTDKQFLLDTKLMLTRLGVQAKVVSGSIEGYKSLPNGRGKKDYFCQTTYRLLIGNTDTYHLTTLGIKFNRLVVHNNKPQRDARRFVYVVSVEDRTPEDTYCFTDPKNHTGTFNGIVTGQCGEISLQSQSMCNLSEVVIRKDDTLDDLKRKIRIATILGTLQSTFTNFPYLRKKWSRNIEEERLLGVSLTGIMDHSVMSGGEWSLPQEGNVVTLEETLMGLKQVAIDTNKEWSERLGINQSVAITCVKPSGTVSQLVNSSSGIHPRYSEYYIRTIRQSVSDPLTQYMIDAGVPNEVSEHDPNTIVFSFPIKSPDGAITADKVSAIDQLELWKVYKEHWAEHTISCTVYVKDDEWLEVGSWVYKNFNSITGISFLPHTSHNYKQAPYQPITKDEYYNLSTIPLKLDWDILQEYEKADYTTGAKELACAGGSCSIDG